MPTYSSAPPPAHLTLKERLDSYISTRLPEISTKVGRRLIALFVAVFRFLVSLLREAFNR